jgi:hypothetical protein
MNHTVEIWEMVHDDRTVSVSTCLVSVGWATMARAHRRKGRDRRTKKAELHLWSSAIRPFPLPGPIFEGELPTQDRASSPGFTASTETSRAGLQDGQGRATDQGQRPPADSSTGPGSCRGATGDARPGVVAAADHPALVPPHLHLPPFAIGEDPVSVMRQLGHIDPAFTLRAYAHSMSRDAGERERLRALINGDHGGIGAAFVGSERDRRDAGCGAEFVVGNSNRTTSWAASRRSSG